MAIAETHELGTGGAGGGQGAGHGTRGGAHQEPATVVIAVGVLRGVREFLGELSESAMEHVVRQCIPGSRALLGNLSRLARIAPTFRRSR